MEQIRQLRIVAKTWETPDAATFTLSPEDGRPLDYQPGQYLSLIFQSVSGEKRRAYSFSSAPGVDALPAITVRRVPNGEFSNRLLTYAEPGNLLLAVEPNGFFLLPERPVETLFYIAAGSGITPIMSHLKTVLKEEPTRLMTLSRQTGTPRIALFYANRDSAHTLFKKQIDGWMSAFPDRFEGTYFFSREKNADHARYAHLNNALLEELVLGYFGGHLSDRDRKGTQFYLCAPMPLMRMAEMTLRVLDFPASQFHKETFQPDSRLVRRSINPFRTHRIIATGRGERHEFDVYEGETILGGALRQGIALPYTCKMGVCFTCVARCVRGAVEVEFVETTRREEAGSLVNTCIGYAASDEVELSYDIN